MSFFKHKPKIVDMEHMPQHIAFIMDGNGRWAKARHLPRSAGHRAGANTLRNTAKLCKKFGIRYVTVYAFSTENWTRPKEEVDTIMSLIAEYLKNADELIGDENARICFIGDRSALSDELKTLTKQIEEDTKNRSAITINLALNYGGRQDIMSATKTLCKKAMAGEISPENITAEDFSSCLYTNGTPDPDLIIRTSGEMRLSNFLLWQSAYAEFWYTKAYWPDFGKKELTEAILNYQNRTRRFGGLKNE